MKSTVSKESQERLHTAVTALYAAEKSFAAGSLSQEALEAIKEEVGEAHSACLEEEYWNGPNALSALGMAETARHPRAEKDAWDCGFEQQFHPDRRRFL